VQWTGFKKKEMIGLIVIGISAVLAKKIDDSADYKEPKGKYKNRYK